VDPWAGYHVPAGADTRADPPPRLAARESTAYAASKACVHEPMDEPAFTIGVEEEYFLVDCDSRDLVREMPPTLLANCEAAAPGQQVSPELLRSQIEIGTRVCADFAQVHASLKSLRRAIADSAAPFGLAPVAASTHPFAAWAEQKRTERPRYAALSQQMQAAARRALICGMHVHVGIGDTELRIDLLDQFSYFLPHLLALSCSSPFWRGADTGLKSYRPTVFDALPRTGLPERFGSFAEFQRHVELLVRAGLIEDASMIWWDLRPSARYPTLEVRIMDVCTELEDAVCLAALATCSLRYLWRLRVHNQRWRSYSHMLLKENRWRAMRYSFDEGLLDLGRGRILPFPQLLEEWLELIQEDAAALGCEAACRRARHILAHGTSAHRQLRVYQETCAAGGTEHEAQLAVVDHLIAETVKGVADEPASTTREH
jgi:carboxylate-amine ligase